MNKFIYLCVISLTVYAQQVFCSIEKTSYRGWDNCYKISNDSVSVTIVPESGGRVMRFEKDGVNILYENSSLNGKILADYENNWFEPDGGRFDYGPEAVTSYIHNITWLGVWTAEVINQYTIKIISPSDTSLKLLSERTFSLDSMSSHLTITLSMKNISKTETKYWFWNRTLVKVGGKLIIPMNTADSQLPDKWVRCVWGNPNTYFSDATDPGIKIFNDSVFSLNPSLAKSQLYGTDSKKGWMAYSYAGKLFVKKYNYVRDQTYGVPLGLISQTYTNGRFLEMEPVSPMVSLKPDSSYSYTENWYLYKYPNASTSSTYYTQLENFINNGYQNTTGVSINEPSISIELAPNPAINTFRIVSGAMENQKGSITVFSMDGRRVYEKNNTRLINYQEVDLSNCKAGFYLVSVTMAHSRIHKILSLNK